MKRQFKKMVAFTLAIVMTLMQLPAISVKADSSFSLSMESVDMGSYDTCPFGCPYCYAVRSEKLVQTNRKKHDPNSPYLIGE